MIFVGVDYSLVSPAVCVFNDTAGEFCFDACDFIVISDKKIPCATRNIGIYPHKPWSNPNERYHNIADFLLNMIYFEYGDNQVLIEDYSFGSKGKVFHIAENTAVLQYNLWLKHIPYNKIPPTTLKKWATGKGNATKEMMYDAFVKQTGVDIFKTLGLKKSKTNKIDSPVSDIVDAYWLCRYAYINKDVCYHSTSSQPV